MRDSHAFHPVPAHPIDNRITAGEPSRTVSSPTHGFICACATSYAYAHTRALCFSYLECWCLFRREPATRPPLAKCVGREFAPLRGHLLVRPFDPTYNSICARASADADRHTPALRLLVHEAVPPPPPPPPRTSRASRSPPGTLSGHSQLGGSAFSYRLFAPYYSICACTYACETHSRAPCTLGNMQAREMYWGCASSAPQGAVRVHRAEIVVKWVEWRPVEALRIALFRMGKGGLGRLYRKQADIM